MARASAEPQVLLDGARVLAFALLARSRDGASAVVGGIPVESVAGLVIAEDMVDGGVFLLHCTDEWFTLAAEHYEEDSAAKRAAATAYAAASIPWQDFRALSPAEEQEVETTRAFLKEIAGK